MLWRNRFRYQDRINVMGVFIDPLFMEKAVQTIIRWAEAERPHGGARYVCVSGVHGIVESQSDATFRNILNGSDLNVPDGMPMVWLGRIAGFDETDRVFGPDLMLRVCEASVGRAIRHFFYGGKDGIAVLLAETLQRKYPGLWVAGVHSPPFRNLTTSEARQLVAEINQLAPDILWVGLSTPKQERWMNQFSPFLHAKVMLGVGAAFDYNTGLLLRAPHWVQRSGLEWCFRLFQEPRRLLGRYMRNNPRFLWSIMLQAMGRMTNSPKAQP